MSSQICGLALVQPWMGLGRIFKRQLGWGSTDFLNSNSRFFNWKVKQVAVYATFLTTLRKLCHNFSGEILIDACTEYEQYKQNQDVSKTENQWVQLKAVQYGFHQTVTSNDKGNAMKALVCLVLSMTAMKRLHCIAKDRKKKGQSHWGCVQLGHGHLTSYKTKTRFDRSAIAFAQIKLKKLDDAKFPEKCTEKPEHTNTAKHSNSWTKRSAIRVSRYQTSLTTGFVIIPVTRQQQLWRNNKWIFYSVQLLPGERQRVRGRQIPNNACQNRPVS